MSTQQWHKKFTVTFVLLVMPANKDKSCRLCGSRQHTLATCTLPVPGQTSDNSESRLSGYRRGSWPQEVSKACQEDAAQESQGLQDCSSETILWRCRRFTEPSRTQHQKVSRLELSRAGVGRASASRFSSNRWKMGALYYRCTNWECKKYTNALFLQK